MLKVAYHDLPHNTYKSAQGAVDKFINTCDKVGVADMRYVIAVDPASGRFFPIALPKADQAQDAIFLAQNGVYVFRN